MKVFVGDPRAALSKPDSLVLTRTAAARAISAATMSSVKRSRSIASTS